MRRALAITLAAFALLYGLACLRYAPPAPAPTTTPTEKFSADRARQVQEWLVGDGATRAVGTEGNLRARTAITRELVKLGWTVDTPAAWSCTKHATCAYVTNIVGVLPGTDPLAAAVLVSAHYDSVLAGPGASDDGLGVAAVLESARALSAGPRPRRTVIALLTDAEEAGLIGASAFVRNDPRAKKLDATVNVDARGSHGPSQMFETSAGNAWVVSMMAHHLERPVTTSLFYEVYRRMPNDTDFTFTKTVAAGVNFANTATIADYHTPLDNLADSDRGTLQHHGDHVLGMTRAFADAPPRTGDPGGDAVWFDVMAFAIVSFPARWTVLVALVALALVCGRAFRMRARGLGLLVFLPVLAAGLVATLVAGWIQKTAGALPLFWVAHPAAALIAVHAAAIGAALAGLLAIARRSDPKVLWAGTWIGWGVVGASTASFVPGMSYLVVVPTIAAAIGGAISFEVACIVPAIVAAIVVLPLDLATYEALGFALPMVLTLPAILLVTTIAPLVVGIPKAWHAPKALAAVFVLAALVASFVPKFSPACPRRVDVVFRQDEGHARVFVDASWGFNRWGDVPAPMLAALGASNRLEAALPWSPPAASIDVPPLDAKPPSVEVLSVETGARHHLRMRLRSERGASALAIMLPIDRRGEVKVEGQYASPRVLEGGALLALLGVPPEGVVVELDAAGEAPIPITIFDRTAGVPAGTKAEEIVTIRRTQAADAVTTQDGDLTVMTKTVSL